VADAEERASRLLSASPAVIYSFKAKDDFAATFVSDNITRLFGYGSREYFWRERVHPEDLPRIEAEVSPQPEAAPRQRDHRAQEQGARGALQEALEIPLAPDLPLDLHRGPKGSRSRPPARS
jgi:hypothetical protein